jgi:hypothetical protein
MSLASHFITHADLAKRYRVTNQDGHPEYNVLSNVVTMCTPCRHAVDTERLRFSKKVSRLLVPEENPWTVPRMIDGGGIIREQNAGISR